MKTRTLILCGTLFFLTSCVRNDENINPIIGTWSLTQMTSTWHQESYNDNVIWTFDEDNVRIENHLTNDESEYPYSIIEHENRLFVNIKTGGFFDDYFFYTEISSDEMTIYQGIAQIIIENDTVSTGISDAYALFFEK